MRMTREIARNLVRTSPYPETRNGLHKFHEEVWINGLNGQPDEAGAIKQLNKNLQEYKHDLKGFYCESETHTGVFSEYDPIRGYGPDHITWKYFIHYAQYA